MATLTLRLKVVSPIFISRTKEDAPEMRVPSIRGQLRYWYRALLGISYPIEEIWKKESALFGSTSTGSAISIRLQSANIQKASVPLMPHRSDRRGAQPAITGGVYQLELVTRPGVELPIDLVAALKLWLLLGGIGKRSRRMFGSLHANDLWEPALDSPKELIRNIRLFTAGYSQKILKLTPLKAMPLFPTLHPDHCRVVVGRDAFPSPEDANKELFRLLRSDKFRSNERAFGHAMGGRRASPLIAQVRQLNDDGYYPVLTIMRSDLKQKDWDTLNDFMEDYSTVFRGRTVWGVGAS